MPSNLGAGTNEDRVIVAKMDDHIFYESTLRAEAFREPKADQLSVLLRVYEYAAFTAARYPKSTSIAAVDDAGTRRRSRSSHKDEPLPVLRRGTRAEWLPSRGVRCRDDRVGRKHC
jgi:hypothetical protein